MSISLAEAKTLAASKDRHIAALARENKGLRRALKAIGDMAEHISAETTQIDYNPPTKASTSKTRRRQ